MHVCLYQIPQIDKSAIDFHNVATCELRALWMSKHGEEIDLEYTVEVGGISKDSFKIIIDYHENEKGQLSPAFITLHP